jgi:hypothetical protein
MGGAIGPGASLSHVEYLCPHCKSVMNRSKQPFSDGHFHPLQKIKCRDCGYTTKWYDMIERRSKALASGVGEGGSPAVASVLQETIFASGGRESQIVDDHDDDSVVAEVAINTPAGTHDGSDVTLDAVAYTDGINAAASGHMGVIYTMTATYAGTISFARWRLRASRNDFSGGPTGSQITPAKNATGFSENYSILSRTTTLVAAPPVLDLSLDVQLDPRTGLPWTLARFNDGLMYGFQLDLDRATTGVGEGVDCEVRCYEFWIELWGPA